MTKEAIAAKELQAATAQVREIVGRVQVDIRYAKRDIAWGKLGATDLGDIAKLIRNTSIPIVGISSIVDIFYRMAERRGSYLSAEQPPLSTAETNRERKPGPRP